MASQKTSEIHAFRKQIRQEACINEIKFFSLTDGSLYLFIKINWLVSVTYGSKFLNKIF